MSAFDALHHDDRPIEPDRRFAAQLRSRLEDELAAASAPTIDLHERNITMPTTTDIAADAALPTGTHRLTPYIAVTDGGRAIEWYIDVFGAREVVRYVADDDRVGHAELDLGGARLYLSDEYPDHGVTSPATLGGTPVGLHVTVPDVDAVWTRAIAAGAQGQRPPEDQPYGERSSTFVDPFGHRWMVQTTIATPSRDEIETAMEGFRIIEPDVEGEDR